MELHRIFVTQRRLRNPAQIPKLIRAFGVDLCVPRIRLGELEDGTVFIIDGHHRCVAALLSGRTRLHWGEYILYPVENPRAMFGQLTDHKVLTRLVGESFTLRGKSPKRNHRATKVRITLPEGRSTSIF